MRSQSSNPRRNFTRKKSAILSKGSCHDVSDWQDLSVQSIHTYLSWRHLLLIEVERVFKSTIEYTWEDILKAFVQTSNHQ